MGMDAFDETVKEVFDEVQRRKRGEPVDTEALQSRVLTMEKRLDSLRFWVGLIGAVLIGLLLRAWGA